MTDAALIERFQRLYHKYAISAHSLLQTFAEAVGMNGQVFSPPATLPGSAAAVIAALAAAREPEWELTTPKQQAGIRYLRRLLMLHRSLTVPATLEQAVTALDAEWYTARGLQGAGTLLVLEGEAYVLLPKAYLVLCEVYRRRPATPLYYLVEGIVKTGEARLNGPPSPPEAFLLRYVATQCME